MRAYGKMLSLAMHSEVWYLRWMFRYFTRKKGKELRPMLVLLSAGLHGKVGVRAHVGSAMVSLLHQATLLHDDVVDGSSYRRGLFTVGAIWRNKKAVLLGDFMLSRGLRLSVDYGAHDMLKMVCEAVEAMSEGELWQAQKARRLNISEEEYKGVIEKKTASLWGACCGIGALSAGASEAEVSRMYRVGLDLGMAFQIRDDLFDYDKDNHSGKPYGLDMKERKLTLPFLRAYSQGSYSDRRQLRRLLRNQDWAGLFLCISRTDAMDYTRKTMLFYAQQATEALSVYSNSVYHAPFLEFIRYTWARNK